MNPVAHPTTLRRLRALAPLGWAGLVLWAWATVALPALHAAQHAREATHERPQAPNRQRIQAIIDEVLGQTPGEHVRLESHGHSHDSHGPAKGPHGKGSIEHLDALFAAVAVFAAPAGFQALEAAPSLPAPTLPAFVTLRLSRNPRGPPPLLLADRLSA
jgi:hypothetical protein